MLCNVKCYVKSYCSINITTHCDCTYIMGVYSLYSILFQEDQWFVLQKIENFVGIRGL